MKLKTMLRLALAGLLVGQVITMNAQSRISLPGPVSTYKYYHPTADKEEWQRLYLMLSSTFVNVVNEGQVDLDSGLLKASSSLGLSRFSILAEGFADNDLRKNSQWIDRKEPATGVRLLAGLKGRQHLKMLLLLGAYYAFQRNTYNHFKDSVIFFLQEATAESTALHEPELGRHALCILAKMYVQGNKPRGDSIFALLISQSRAANDRKMEAKALVYRSRFTPPLATTIVGKMNDSKAAAEIYKSIGNKEGQLNALTDAGYLLTVTGDLEGARDLFEQAYHLGESIHFPYMHYNAQALSMVSTFMGKFGEPLRYTLEMIRTSETCRDSIGWGYFHSNLALMLSAEGRIEESYAVTEKAIEHFLRQRNPTIYIQLIPIIYKMGNKGQGKEALAMTTAIERQVNQPETFADRFAFHYAFANCYLFTNELNKAEWHIKKMDSLESAAESIRPPIRKADIYEMNGLLLLKKGQYAKARLVLDSVFSTNTLRTRTLSADLDIYRTLLFIDSTLGDNIAAVEHYKRYAALLDSTFRVAKIRQAEELQVLYQIQEKESQILALTQRATLEKEKSEKEALLRKVTIAGIFASGIIAVLLYRQNRLRKKSNRIISRNNEQLQVLVNDREWLLKEIHHRVKNNLQIVISLLNSQSVYIDNDDARVAIDDSQRRMHAMALIHQKLYLSENMSTILMPDYINELVFYVQESFDTGGRVSFEQDIAPVELDVSQAIPLGLILNECIVNVMKYAFPDGRSGVVNLYLQPDGPDHLLLQIADNGVGLPAGINISKHNSLGFDLMHGLAKQLNGVLSFRSNGGLHIELRFLRMSIHQHDPSGLKKAIASV